MTKATLKHVANQYILIVDERPKIGDKYINIFTNNRFTREILDDRYYFSNHWKVIAAENLESVKGIRIEHNNHLLKSKQQRIRELLDGKEVEVTEEEDYWVVKL